MISPHDPDVLYVAANVVFRSVNEGASWETISPDLTRNDVTKMEPSGGPITLDTTFVEHYGTIFALAESPHERGVFWAGSDDGLVHISRDGGETWDDVTPMDLPDWTRIDVIEVSPHDPASAYLSATRYKLDDPRPFLYKTNDYGATWLTITGGIPEDDFTRVIREDPARRGLLYAGTESGAYVSMDDGASWRSLRRNLPVVPVTDLAVKGNELAAATNGRSFWILDELTVLRQLAEDAGDAAVRLFRPSDTYRTAPAMGVGRDPGPGKNYNLGIGAPATFYERKTPGGGTVRTMLDAGTNPPDGLVVTYYLKDRPENGATLTFLDAEGRTISSFTSSPGRDSPPAEAPLVAVEAGMNRFVWDLRYPEAKKVQGPGAPKNGLAGPLVAPGTYQVRLTAGESVQTQTFDLLKDPRIAATQQDLDTQLELLRRIVDMVSETHDAVNRLRSVRRQADEWVVRSRGRQAWEAVSSQARGLKEKLSAIEEKLIQSRSLDGLERIGLPARLNAKLAIKSSVVASDDSAPTKQSHAVFGELSTRVNTQLHLLQEVFDADLAAFVAVVDELDIPAVVAE